MDLATLALICSALGVVVSGVLAWLFIADPENGLKQSTHRRDQLPFVMADRYIAFAWLALFATLYRDMNVIAAVFAAFAFMALADAWIYARAGHAYVKHLMAGIGALLVVAIALMARGGA